MNSLSQSIKAAGSVIDEAHVCTRRAAMGSAAAGGGTDENRRRTGCLRPESRHSFAAHTQVSEQNFPDCHPYLLSLFRHVLPDARRPVSCGRPSVAADTLLTWTAVVRLCKGWFWLKQFLPRLSSFVEPHHCARLLVPSVSYAAIQRRSPAASLLNATP